MGMSFKTVHDKSSFSARNRMRVIEIITFSLSGSSVWKVRLATPRWENGSDTCGFIACQCDGSAVKWHRNQPLLFDMTNNPREDEPIDFSDPRYVEYISKTAHALKRHQETLDPHTTSQTSWWNFLWKPHLQPCCNFPHCSCTDPKYP